MDLYYKQNGDQKWKGPGNVVGHDGAVIFIGHGGFFIKAHCSAVQLAHDLENSNSNHQIENIDNSQDEEKKSQQKKKLTIKKLVLMKVMMRVK